MTRLTDDDRHIGPLTWGKSHWKAWRLVAESHGGDDGEKWNTLVIQASGHVARLYLPRIIRPQRTKKKAQYWDAATIERLGRDWYWDEHSREYGVCLSEGHLSIRYGIQPGDSTRDQYCGYFLPWTQWRHVRFSLYQPDGTHFYTQLERGGMEAFSEQLEAEKQVGKVKFKIRDFDGEIIDVVTHIQEREWRFGTGAFSWLSWFRKPKIVRSLDIAFGSEVGREKGSWKGGTIGHSITMLDGETPEQAFGRYCEQEHRSKSGRYKIQLIEGEHK